MNKIFLLGVLLTLPFMTWAAPAPFGLELGKTSINSAKLKYSLTRTGINKYSKGKMFTIETSSIKFDGLQKMTLIFSKEDILLAVLTRFPKSKFETLLNYLNSKYNMVSKNIPFVGNKKAKFESGDTEIILDAPHMRFQMKMDYIHRDLLKLFESQSNLESQKIKRNEKEQL